MKQLNKYAFVNAKIRAMLSYLIEPEEFNRLADSKDIYEIIQQLKATNYNAIAERPREDSLDMVVLEKEFIKIDVEIFRKVFLFVNSKNEKDFIKILLQRFELEELKVILRIWHKKILIDPSDYILNEKIVFDIDFKKILLSKTIEEIILILDSTVYKKPLLEMREKFKQTDSLFYLEIALDIDYYKRIFECMDNFTSIDRKIAKKILGIEIDIENINWLIRLRKYYALNIGDILEWVIPGGDRINKDTIRSFYTSNGISKVVESIAIGPYAKIKDLIEENASLIEGFLYQILMKEIKKSLAGYPFTIGTVLGYLILKREETKNIISLLYAKNYGWDREKLSSLVNF